MSKLLEEHDFETAAHLIDCDVASVKAVAEVESAGDGFLQDGSTKILFEGHIFFKYTKGKYKDYIQIFATHRGPKSITWAGAKSIHDWRRPRVLIRRQRACLPVTASFRLWDLTSLYVAMSPLMIFMLQPA